MAAIDSGTAAAYLALGVMAVVPIYYGSWGSLKGLKSKAAEKVTKGGEYVSSSSSEEESETLRTEDAYWFPVIGSCVLFGTYLIFKFLNPYYFNLLITAYFAILGTAALTKVVVATVRGVSGFRPSNFKIVVTKRAKEVLAFRFSYLHIVVSVLSALFNAYYVYSENWVASNVLGLSFSTNAIHLLALDSFTTGIILLSGLFIYDIFWVFGTEVMVTVAKKFNGPIKVVFPKNITAEKWQFTMLGLGDIVIPGIFVALCLRFDYHLALQHLRKEIPAGTTKHYRFPRPYFTACFVAYIAGLVVTVLVMHVTQAAQPALLYLSPACIISVLATAAVRGELKELFAYAATAKLAEDNKVLESEAKIAGKLDARAAARATGGSASASEAVRRGTAASAAEAGANGALPEQLSEDERDASAVAGDVESAGASPARKSRKKKKPKKPQNDEAD